MEQIVKTGVAKPSLQNTRREREPMEKKNPPAAQYPLTGAGQGQPGLIWSRLETSRLHPNRQDRGSRRQLMPNRVNTALLVEGRSDGLVEAPGEDPVGTRVYPG